MKKKILTLAGFLSFAVMQAAAQGYAEVTYNHDSSIMNQFTTMETGAGALTPAWYYNLFHKNYQKDANIRNKISYRTEMMALVTKEKIPADDVDSAYVKRAKVEALNIESRSKATDVTWLVEKKKIESKMNLFNNNISKIVSCGGTSEDYRTWRNIYNCLECAVKVTRDSYLDLGQRKKEYLAIYQDIVKRNYTLVRQLMYWNNCKKAKKIKEDAVNPHRLSSNVTVATDALRRWQTAAGIDGISSK